MIFDDDIIVDEVEQKIESMKDTFTAKELLEMNIENPKSLWQPFYPECAFGVLAGEPDTGKSLFDLQFCLTVAAGKDSFLGHALNLKHGRALFIETEDNVEEVARRVKRQFRGLHLTNPNLPGFRFHSPLITDNSSKYNLFDTIRRLLDAEQVDIVIISSFGDAFIGNDTNSNFQMRESASQLTTIAHEYKTFVKAIHHINKSQYGRNPTQAGIQGGSALIQKARLACHLSNGIGNEKYFSITKGNHLRNDIKQQALKLILNDDLIFEYTGEKVARNQIENLSGQAEKTMIDWDFVFAEKNFMRRAEIQEICRNEYDMRERTIDRRLNESLKNGTIRKDEFNFYSLPASQT